MNFSVGTIGSFWYTANINTSSVRVHLLLFVYSATYIYLPTLAVC